MPVERAFITVPLGGPNPSRAQIALFSKIVISSAGVN
jgi:hypothetical protein